MTYPGSGGPWQPNDPNQQPGGPGSGPFPAQGGYPHQGGYPQQGGYPPPGYQQQGGYPHTGPQPAQGGYPQQGGYQQGGYQQGGFPQTGPQPAMGYGGGYPPQPPKKSRKGLIIGAIVAVIAIAAGSVVTVMALNRSGPSAGAPSPTAAADNLVGALGKGDLAGVLTSLAPAESSILVDLNKDMTEELKRLDVYKSDAKPEEIHGVEIKTTDLKYDEAAAEKVNDHLTITKLVGGRLTIDADIAKAPFTDRFLQATGLKSDPQHEEVDIAEVTRNGKKPIRIATVKVNDNWYPSLFYTIADYALQDADQAWPKQGIANNGAGSPQEAVKQLAQAAADGKIERVIELLPPDEMGALHDAGPVLLEMAGRTKSTGVKITKFEGEVQDVTGGKKVVITEAEAQIEGGTVKVRRDGDCYSYEAEGEREKFCADQLGQMLDGVGGSGGPGGRDKRLPADARKALVNLASGMLKNTGVVTTEVGGKWYVSPLRSFTNIEVTVLQSLNAEDVYALLNLIK